MESSHRVVSIILIWASFAAIGIFGMPSMGVEGGAAAVMIFILGVCAVAATFAVAIDWTALFASSNTASSAQAQEERRKIKTDDAKLIDRMIASMDEAELEALRRRLIESGDGEYGSLDELMRRQK